MFDISEARSALQRQKRDLQAECEANSKLQRRFDQISSQLRSSVGTSSTTSDSQSEPIVPGGKYSDSEHLEKNSSQGRDPSRDGLENALDEEFEQVDLGYSSVETLAEEDESRRSSKVATLSRSIIGGHTDDDDNEIHLDDEGVNTSQGVDKSKRSSKGQAGRRK